MKKILFYNGSLRMGGLERVLTEILQGINKEKFQIDLILSKGIKEINIFEKDVPEEIRIHYLVTEKTRRKLISYRKKKKNIFYKILYNYIMAKEKKEKRKGIAELNTENYDVLIDFDMGLSKEIEKIKTNKKIVWIHSSIRKKEETLEKLKSLEKRLEKYDKIVTICDDMKDEVQECYPQLKDRIVRIYNPFNFQRIKELYVKDESLTAEQRLKLKEKYCVAVARFDLKPKDFYTLFKAFSILKKENSDLKLYLVGDGDGREQIESWIRELKLEEIVYLVGQTTNPYIWMKNAQIFIHSSRYEGFGVVLVEAMACNVPVISTDCPTGPKEILEKGKSGILVPVGDAEAFAKNIKLLMEDKEKKENLLNNANMRIKEFDNKISLEQIEKLVGEN